MKKILSFLLMSLLVVSVAYAGNLHRGTDVGHDGDDYGSYYHQVWGGGSDCVMTTETGNWVTGLKCPGFLRHQQYDPEGSELVTYWEWFAPSGVRKISSGATGDSGTGYGVPSDTAFDLEASGATM